MIVAALYKPTGDRNMCGRLVTWPLQYHHPLVENPLQMVPVRDLPKWFLKALPQHHTHTHTCVSARLTFWDQDYLSWPAPKLED